MCIKLYRKLISFSIHKREQLIYTICFLTDDIIMKINNI